MTKLISRENLFSKLQQSFPSAEVCDNFIFLCADYCKESTFSLALYLPECECTFSDYHTCYVDIAQIHLQVCTSERVLDVNINAETFLSKLTR